MRWERTKGIHCKTPCEVRLDMTANDWIWRCSRKRTVEDKSLFPTLYNETDIGDVLQKIKNIVEQIHNVWQEENEEARLAT